MNLDFEPTDVPAVFYQQKKFKEWRDYWFAKYYDLLVERNYERWNFDLTTISTPEAKYEIKPIAKVQAKRKDRFSEACEEDS